MAEELRPLDLEDHGKPTVRSLARAMNQHAVECEAKWKRQAEWHAFYKDELAEIRSMIETESRKIEGVSDALIEERAKTSTMLKSIAFIGATLMIVLETIAIMIDI